MDTFAKDFVTLLQYLLPGFVAAWIIYSFTSYPKPSQFERVVQALIFTIFLHTMSTRVLHWNLPLGDFQLFYFVTVKKRASNHPWGLIAILLCKTISSQ